MRAGRTLTCGLVLAPLLFGCTQCRRSVAIKQDSPQTAVVSLIKVYAAATPLAYQQLDQELVDDRYLKRLARSAACEDALLQDGVNFMQAVLSEHFTACACGAKGKAAASKPFTQSTIHRGLLTLGWSTKTCRVVSSAPAGPNAISSSRAPFCEGDRDLSEVFAVTFLCGKDQFIAHVGRDPRDAKYRLFGFGSETETQLWRIGKAAELAGRDSGATAPPP
jgi:hypothetical protein